MNHFFATSFCTGLDMILKSKNHHFRGLLLFIKEAILQLSQAPKMLQKSFPRSICVAKGIATFPMDPSPAVESLLTAGRGEEHIRLSDRLW